jgi:hypothetical protein
VLLSTLFGVAFGHPILCVHRYLHGFLGNRQDVKEKSGACSRPLAVLVFPHVMDAPDPTPQDHENARIRREIAERQAGQYAEFLAWAEAAFGPGWLPRCRHYLADKDEEERARGTGERPRAAATVYTVQSDAGDQRHFTVEGDRVIDCASYEDGFGPMLLEPHPTAGFMHRGQWCRIHRYSLCWSPFELYEPKTAEQLAALRASCQRRKVEREEKRWAAENPLLAWAEGEKLDEDRPAEDRGRR